MTVRHRPWIILALLIAAAFAIAEFASFEVERPSSAALVFRIVVKDFPSMFSIARPLMLCVVPTLLVEVS